MTNRSRRSSLARLARGAVAGSLCAVALVAFSGWSRPSLTSRTTVASGAALVRRSLTLSARSKGYHVKASFKLSTSGAGTSTSTSASIRGNSSTNGTSFKQSSRISPSDWTGSHHGNRYVQVVVGSAAASRPAGGHWSCSLESPLLWVDPPLARLNAAQPMASLPPNEHFSPAKSIHSGGSPAWRVTGHSASKAGGTTTSFSATLIIVRKSDQLRELDVVSTNKNRGSRHTVDLDEHFSRYGRSVSVQLPKACRPTRSGYVGRLLSPTWLLNLRLSGASEGQGAQASGQY